MPNDLFEYNLDYYSGAQAAVYMEHVLIDEITSLQWTVQQAKVPIYGYASQFFDTMAAGTIIVQGSFSINFVEAGYLWSVLDYLQSFETDNMSKALERHMKSEKAALEGLKQELSDMLPLNEMNDQIDQGPPTVQVQETMEKYALMAEHSRNTGQPSKAKVINDLVWGPETTTDFFPDKDFTDKRRVDRKALNGFDIYLKFCHDGSATETVHKIEDVHITGKAQTIVIDENPIQEVYSFYAKNVI